MTLAGTGALGRATELVVSRDGIPATRLSGPKLDVQPDKARQARKKAGAANRRIRTRTQNNCRRQIRCRRGPIEKQWLTEIYQKRLNPIFTPGAGTGRQTTASSDNARALFQLISANRLSDAAHHATFALARKARR